MKSKLKLIFSISILSITACDGFNFDFNNNGNSRFNEHEHTYSDSWEMDDEYHWHSATCEHSDKISGKLLHNFSAWKVEIEPTNESEGLRVRRCLTCNYEQTESIPRISNKGFSIDEPLSVDETISLMSNYKKGGVSNNPYYVIGTVSSATYNENYDTISMYFEGHDENSETPFQFYSGVIDSNYIEGNYSTEDFINSTVIIYGYLQKYSYSDYSRDIYEVSYLSSYASPSGKAETPTIVYTDAIVGHTHSFSTDWAYDSNAHWHVATCEHTNLKSGVANHNYGEWIIDIPATTLSNGSKHRICSICQYEERAVVNKISDGSGTFSLYTFNDFHGAVKEDGSYRMNHSGLARFGTYLKKVSGDDSLIIDSGDTFQGSIESNYNDGALISDVFDYAHVDVHTIGNHDFDWGQDKLIANKNRHNGIDNYKTTYLGANIYDYDIASHTNGNIFQSRLGDKYYIKTLENGLKVGVIGVIGSDQITSICSPLVEDICFTDHIKCIKELSDELRMDEDVDVVIASIHNSAEDTRSHGLTDVSPVSGKKYVDYVACGHSHYNECLTENNVYYTQAACYGEMIYKADFTLSNGVVVNVKVDDITYNDICNATQTIDPNISSLIANYSKDYASIGSQIIASSVSGTFDNTEEVPNLVAKAMYETARKDGYTVDIACVNNARYDLTGTSWNYSQVYEALPFDNVCYVIKCKGSKNIRELAYSGNYCYHSSTLTSLSSNTWYTAVVIDYLLWHTNSSRIYDYFDHSSSNMQILGTLTKSDGSNYLYRDIFSDYVKGLSGTLYSSDYSSSGCYALPSY